MSATLPEPPGGKQNRGIAFMVVTLIVTIIASLVVTLRIYIRVRVKRTFGWDEFGWDDGLIIFSLLLAIVSTAINIPEVIAGYGQHVYYLSNHQLSEALKWNYLATPLLVFSLAASKISICLLLLRVLKQTQANLKRYFPYAVIAILTIISVPSAGYSLGQCQPVSKLWNPTAPGHCKDPQIYVRLGYANGDVSVSSSLLAIQEENVSIIVACVPTLGPLFAFFSDKIKTLSSRQHHTQLGKTARPSRKELPIPLGLITDPTSPTVHYKSSAEPHRKQYQGRYGSQTSVVPGVQRTMRVNVIRDDDLV